MLKTVYSLSSLRSIMGIQGRMRRNETTLFNETKVKSIKRSRTNVEPDKISSFDSPSISTSTFSLHPYRVCQLHLKAYDISVLDSFVEFCYEVGEKLDMTMSGKIPLPTKIKKWTILRSPHINKTARDQLEIRTHKRLLDISNASQETVDTYTTYIKANVPSEVGMKITRYRYETQYCDENK